MRRRFVEKACSVPAGMDLQGFRLGERVKMECHLAGPSVQPCRRLLGNAVRQSRRQRRGSLRTGRSTTRADGIARQREDHSMVTCRRSCPARISRRVPTRDAGPSALRSSLTAPCGSQSCSRRPITSLSLAVVRGLDQRKPARSPGAGLRRVNRSGRPPDAESVAGLSPIQGGTLKNFAVLPLSGGIQ